MKVQWFKVHSRARSRLSLTHLPIQPLSTVKSLDGPRVRVISPVVKEKVYGGKDLLKSQVLSSEWNTERVREDASGDSEDDEMPCVIGESVPCTGIEKGRSEPQLGDDNFFTANAEIFNVMRIESRITVL